MSYAAKNFDILTINLSGL